MQPKLLKRARQANCKAEDSELVVFQSAISSVRSFQLQTVECHGYVELPFNVVRDIADIFNLGLSLCASLFALIRLTAHKAQSQVQCDSGSFVLQEKNETIRKFQTKISPWYT